MLEKKHFVLQPWGGEGERKPAVTGDERVMSFWVAKDCCQDPGFSRPLKKAAPSESESCFSQLSSFRF